MATRTITLPTGRTVKTATTKPYVLVREITSAAGAFIKTEIVSSSKSLTKLQNARSYGDRYFPKSAAGDETYRRYVIRVATGQVVG
jgi:hypothetical protein